jgi:hypothetical protein
MAEHANQSRWRVSQWPEAESNEKDIQDDAKLRHVSLKREQKQWAGGRQYLLDAKVILFRDPCHAHFACYEENSPQKIACLEASQWSTSFELLKQQQQGVRRQQHDTQAAAAAAVSQHSATAGINSEGGACFFFLSAPFDM